YPRIRLGTSWPHASYEGYGIGKKTGPTRGALSLFGACLCEHNLTAVKTRISSDRFPFCAVRLNLSFLLWMVLSSTSDSYAQERKLPLGAAVNATISDYCVNCHDAETKKGGLDLETILKRDLFAHSDTWEHVIRKLRARQMPPVGKNRPEERQYDAVEAQ